MKTTCKVCGGWGVKKVIKLNMPEYITCDNCKGTGEVEE